MFWNCHNKVGQAIKNYIFQKLMDLRITKLFLNSEGSVVKSDLDS